MLTIVNKESAQLIDDIISFIKERKRKQPFKVSTQDPTDTNIISQSGKIT